MNELRENNPDYITAHFGKWGCDVRREPGYDVDDGNTNNIDGDWKVRNEVRHPDEDPKAIFSLTERTNKFITERVQNKEPFYIQLSHYAPHVQNYARPETVEKYKNKRGKKNLQVTITIIQTRIVMDGCLTMLEWLMIWMQDSAFYLIT